MYLCEMEAGRPTKYQAKYNGQAYKLCLLGAIDTELADFFDVNPDTIHEWKKVYPRFKASIDKGKKLADMRVAESLFKLATGYETDEVTFEKCDNKVNLEVTTSGEIKAEDSYKKKVVTKVVPPNYPAVRLWLTNRKPDSWRDKQELEVTNKVIEVLAPPEEDIDPDA